LQTSIGKKLAEPIAKVQSMLNKSKPATTEGGDNQPAAVVEVVKPPLKEQITTKWTELLNWYGEQKHALIGVDITPHYIRLCQMETKKYDGKWRIKHITSSCIKGLFTREDIANHKENYVEHLKFLLEDSGIKTKNAALALPVTGSIVKTVTVPNMSEGDLNRAIATGTFWQNALQMQIDINQYSTYHEIIGRNEIQGTMDILFTATKKSDVDLYAQITKSAGLNPIILDLRCFALKNVFASQVNSMETANEAVVFLELGPDENHILVLGKQRIFTYDIFVSDEEKTAIVESFRNSDILEQFLQRYAMQIQETLNNYSSEHGDTTVKNIYVISYLPLITTFIDKLGNYLPNYHFEECNLFSGVDIPDKFAGIVYAKENLSAWAVPVGMGIRKLKIFECQKDAANESNINLLPGSTKFIKEQKAAIISQVSSALAASVAVILIVASLSIVSAQHLSVSFELSKVDHVESIYKKKKKKLTELRSVLNKLSNLDKIHNNIPSNQGKLLSAYTRVNKSIPDGVWLEKIDFEKPDKIEISGNAIGDHHILEFIDNLDNGDEFKKIALKSMKAMKKESEYTKQSIHIKTFTLKGNINSQEKLPKKKKIKVEKVAMGDDSWQ
ncbi:pilus assembly protein PilM, partial [Rickettsiales bacterium]|nr:pilus assembly protein PilM [Rickettsiales bacterium]